MSNMSTVPNFCNAEVFSLELANRHQVTNFVGLMVFSPIDSVHQTCRGMRYLMKNNIVHRDLACRNLLVNVENDELNVKISDLGMSRVMESDYYRTTNGTNIPVRW